MDTKKGWDTAHLEVPMSRRTFTREFKLEAIRLVEGRGPHDRKCGP